MSSSEGLRSVRIGSDERTGWSSDRPRREGSGPERGPRVSVRCRVLPPTDRQRYTPGSVVLVVGGSPEVREAFAQRRFEDRGAILSPARVRKLLEGRVGADELEAAATKVLDAAVAKRLAADESIAVLVDGLEAEERARFVVPAAKVRRPRHLIFLDMPKDQVDEADRDVVNELRRTLDAGGLGEEGFMTALRLSGRAIDELQRIVFRPPPADD
jgi:NAD(P)-dependent dehydrogenase (short-subunit alcohol dehydrogenase family)